MDESERERERASERENYIRPVSETLSLLSNVEEGARSGSHRRISSSMNTRAHAHTHIRSNQTRDTQIHTL